MRTYELVTILSPILNQEQATEAWGRIKEFITTRNGEITREQNWGTRRLAYPIRKGSINFLEGSYYLTQFATERPFNFDLEVFLRRDERVLRSLVTVADPDAPLAQPGMAAAAAAAARAAAEAAAAAAAAAAETQVAAAPDAEATEAETADAEAPVLAEPALEQPAAEAVVEPPGEEPVAEVETPEVDGGAKEETVAELAGEPETGPEPAKDAEPVAEPESQEPESQELEERSES